MNILIAPDSFKESLSATEVASIIAETLEKESKGISCRQLPVADGGEGTMESLMIALKGTKREVQVHDPLGRLISASYGIKDQIAIIEMAQSSGLMRLSTHERNPLLANTYGLGEMILEALNQGAKRLIIAIGGSATNDGGTGMLRALGVKFLDDRGVEIIQLPERLSEIVEIDSKQIDSRLKDIPIEVACDIDNPLLGKQGATAVYGPQKGLTPDMHEILEQGLAHYAALTETLFRQSFASIPGTGAAGGLGFALVTFLQAKLKPGVDLVLDVLDFEKHVKWADLVITGEGKIDAQTIHGKTPTGVAKQAHLWQKPTIIVAGKVADGWQSLYDIGVKNVYAITPQGINLTEALKNAANNLKNTIRTLAIDIRKSHLKDIDKSIKY